MSDMTKETLATGPRVTIGVIPKHNENLIVTKDYRRVMNTIETLVGIDKPVLLLGHAGVGKNQAICEVANKLGKRVIRVNCSGDMRTSSLLGRINAIVVEKSKPDGTTEKVEVIGWQEGFLPIGMEEGDWVIFDEINSLDSDIAFALHGLMDDGQLAIANNSRIVKKSADFRLFATMNPNSYYGVKTLNQALVDRFVVVEMGFDQGIDNKLLDKLNLDEGCKESFRNVITQIRERYDQQEITQNFGHRTLDMVVELSQYFPLTDAVDMAYSNKLPETEKASVKTIMKDLTQRLEAVKKAKPETKVDAQVKDAGLSSDQIMAMLTGGAKPTQ